MNCFGRGKTIAMLFVVPILMVNICWLTWADDQQRPCSSITNLTWELPADVPGILNDESVRCYAWQSFVSMNWPAKPDAPGKPDPSKQFGDSGPVVWQTFKSANEVFLPDAAKPTPWGHTSPLPSAFASMQARRSAFQLRVLTDSSKVSTQARVDHILAKIPAWEQATGGKPWLTDQSGQLVWYELLMNEDEYNYIVTNEFYDAGKQLASMTAGGNGICLPAGQTVYGSMGAIEVKVAWRVMQEKQDDSKRYFTTDALILKDPRQGPAGGFVQAQLGLVGLHIIHKTPHAPQFIWATFEHIDNCPSRGMLDTGRKYSFYDHGSSDPPNVAPTKTQSLSKPIQVIRESPISPDVQKLNEAMWKLIRSKEPDSVWLNYQLVNAQWPQNGTPLPPRVQIPVTMGGPTPLLLSNTTAETYVQQRESCLSCHRFATIAPTKALPNPSYASDYSFLFTMAKEKP